MSNVRKPTNQSDDSRMKDRPKDLELEKIVASTFPLKFYIRH